MLAGLLCLVLTPAEPVFTATTIGGERITGRLQAIDSSGEITLLAAGPVQIPGERLVHLRRVDYPLPAWPAGAHVVLANGDRIPGRLRSAGPNRLDWQPALTRVEPPAKSPAWTLPLTMVDQLWLVPPASRLGRREPWQNWLAGQRRRDALLLSNGDIFEGTWLDWDPAGEQLRFEYQPSSGAKGSAFRIDRARLAAVAYNTALQRRRPPRDPYSVLVLANGTRLSVQSVRNDGQRLQGTTLLGSPFACPLASLRGLERRHDRVRYLSDLRPRRYQATSYLGKAWPWHRDRAVTGEPLRLLDAQGHVQTLDKGIGMHSASRLSFLRPNGFRFFEALVGLHYDPDPTRGNGQAVVQVLADGQASPETGDGVAVSHASGPQQIRVDVSKARQITLVVNFGPGGAVQDVVNWFDARLVK